MKVDARCQRVLTRGAAFAGPAALVPPAHLELALLDPQLRCKVRIVAFSSSAEAG